MAQTKWTGKVGTYEGRPAEVIWVKGGRMIVRYTDSDRPGPIGERANINKEDFTLTEIIDVPPAKAEIR